ncbi:hypothetical protein [Nubsella zeaxanthinifaciens]|nr:hypothetical protein [Nubsella zeaxanthinifaciens]
MKLINSISLDSTFPKQVDRTPFFDFGISNCVAMQLMICMCICMY